MPTAPSRRVTPCEAPRRRDFGEVLLRLETQAHKEDMDDWCFYLFVFKFLKNGFVGRYEFYDVLATYLGTNERHWLSASLSPSYIDPHHTRDHVSRIETCSVHSFGKRPT